MTPAEAPPAAAAATDDRAHAGAARRRGSPRATVAAIVCVLAVTALVALALLDAAPATRGVAAAVAGVAALAAAAVLARTLAGMRAEHAKLAQREADALRMAELDELTGLGNYRMFSRQLAAEVARSRRHDDPFSLVLLDLDGFKAINDELGHLAGDDALRHVAAALRQTLREEDVCCRQGGDEFAVIAVRAGAQEAAELSERLTRAIEQIPFGLSGERRLGACAGWATFGEQARSADELILRADTALREAKRTPGQAADQPPADGARRPPSRLGRGETARLALLSGLARALAGARDERTLADTTVAFLTGAFDTVGSAALALWPHADANAAAALAPRLVVLGSGGEPPDAGAALAARPTVRRALAAAGAAVVEDDARATWIDGGAVRSELAVAVPNGGGRWGCLLIVCDRPRAYGIVERALAEAIAQQLGRALACRRLLDKLSVSGFGELYRIAADAGADAPGASPSPDAVDDAEQWRLADLTWQVGRELALDDEERRALYLAALFHNVGTVGVPTALLARPGELHEEERAILREHPLIGERMLRALPLLRDAAPIVRHEHERWDGAGYPDGLAGAEIPLAARILLACDVFVAMTSPRPWRPARSFDAARAELRRVAGAQLDPGVVDTLLELLDADWDGDGDARSPEPVGA